MTKEEIADYCYTAVAAARRIGIALTKVESSAGVHFEWEDSLTMTRIVGPTLKDKKEAMFAACERLNEYLSKPGDAKPAAAE